jgi:hypothetical protein
MKTGIKLYYYIRPWIPRSLQLALRCRMVLQKRANTSAIWPIDPNSGTPPPGWNGWPGGKKFALVLTHDVEGPVGQEKCLDLMQMETGMGFRSSFNFVPEGYEVSPAIRETLEINGFEVGVHGLTHDGKLYSSRNTFEAKAKKINEYIEQWGASGFRSPSMHHKLEWLHALNVVYDASTFDTDPFEPHPDGVGTVFPFWVQGNGDQKGYVELPYTLSQDFLLYVLMKEKTPSIWKRKLDWIASIGGMALMNVHPDYMNFSTRPCGPEEFPASIYKEFLEYVASRYRGEYWAVLPKEMAHYWKNVVAKIPGSFIPQVPK